MECYMCNNEIGTLLDDTKLDSMLGTIINGNSVCYNCSGNMVSETIDCTADFFGLPKYRCGSHIDAYNNIHLRYEVPVLRYDSEDEYVYLFINTYTKRCTFEKIDQYDNIIAYYEVKKPTKEKIQEFIDILTKIY